MFKHSLDFQNKLKPLLIKLYNRKIQYEINRNFSQINSKFNTINDEKRSFIGQHPLILNNYYQKRNLFGLWGKPPKEATTNTAITENFNQTENIQKPEDSSVSQIETQNLTAETTTSTPDLPTYDTSGYIPEPPPIQISDVILNSLGEPTLNSLGLASSWTPAGWIQTALEIIHTNLDIPWYQSIIIFTIILRTLMLPLTVKLQRNSAKMRIISPQMVELSQKVTEARMLNNPLEAAKLMHQYAEFMKVNNISIKNVLMPMAQAPIIASMFYAIRSMCKLPVESMQDGGALWFQNLTLADPYYILPVASCLTLYVILERGLETGQAVESMSHTTKYLMRAMPFVALPFFIYFPTGVMVYVCTSNACSLLIALIIGIPRVKKFLKIPILSSEAKILLQESKKKSKGFLEGMRESMKNAKLTNELSQRTKLHQDKLKQSGASAPLKTYKTKPNISDEK